MTPNISEWMNELEASIEQINDYLVRSTSAFESTSLPEGYEDELRDDPQYLLNLESDLEMADHLLAKITEAKFALLALKAIHERIDSKSIHWGEIVIS